MRHDIVVEPSGGWSSFTRSDDTGAAVGKFEPVLEDVDAGDSSPADVVKARGLAIVREDRRPI